MATSHGVLTIIAEINLLCHIGNKTTNIFTISAKMLTTI
jgi:hypothetical protein